MFIHPDIDSFNNLVDLLRWQAENNPQRSFFTFSPDGEKIENELTYYELDQKARQLGAYLQSQASYGDRALLVYSSGRELMIGFFGCLYAGLVPVLSTTPQTKTAFENLIASNKDCGARIALIHASLHTKFTKQFDPISMESLSWLVTDLLPAEATSLDWEMPNLTEDTNAFMIYTSGSTNTAKGIIYKYKALLANIESIMDRVSLSSDSVFISSVPLYHIAGIIWPVINCFAGYQFIYSPIDAMLERPARWIEMVSKQRGTVSLVFNFMIQLSLAHTPKAALTGLDLSSLQTLMVGGEKIRADVLDQFTDYFSPCGFRFEAFTPVYASTEIIAGSIKIIGEPPSVFRLDKSALEKNQIVLADENAQDCQIHVGCGTSINEKKIFIVDPNTLNVLPPGQIGEIWIERINIAEGYWNRAEENAKSFHAYPSDQSSGPFYRTGDLGGFVDNNLIITGRMKEFIILHGKNYYSQDFEKAVERCHPAIIPGCAAAVPIFKGTEELLAIACEVRSENPEFNPDEIVKAVRNAVANAQQQTVSIVALLKPGSVPKTASGKLQRFKIQAKLADKTIDALFISELQMETPLQNLEKSTFVAPGNAMERALAGIWCSVLNRDRIGVNDDFFELGGDSIQGVQIISEVEDVFQVKLTERMLFDQHTIASLAKVINDLRINKPQ
jgi:acyl-CoA synthetase (AMP-forming)/AMP-acid ligase II/acyl carrier protein